MRRRFDPVPGEPESEKDLQRDARAGERRSRQSRTTLFGRQTARVDRHAGELRGVRLRLGDDLPQVAGTNRRKRRGGGRVAGPESVLCGAEPRPPGDVVTLSR